MGFFMVFKLLFLIYILYSPDVHNNLEDMSTCIVINKGNKTMKLWGAHTVVDGKMEIYVVLSMLEIVGL